VEELEMVLDNYSPTHRRMINALLLGRAVTEVAKAEGYSERSVQRTLERLRADLERRLEHQTD
jgi:DNA-directed RNA polymerase specialized sigma24 family protein